MKKNLILVSCFLSSILIIYLGYNFMYQAAVPMQSFSKSRLSSDLREDMIKKNIWSPDCPVSLDRLNILKISYIDFEGNERQDGELVVHDVVADHVLAIFKNLYENKFPIFNMNLINDYDGDDQKSLEANNSSAFNCREIINGNRMSIHAYGLAIDVNPMQNPYLVTEYEPGKTSVEVFPPQGMEYINRSNVREGMVETVLNNTNKSTVVDIFRKNGFTVWGGDWNYPIDWQHFQVTREQAEAITNFSYEEGVAFFNNLISGKK